MAHAAERITLILGIIWLFFVFVFTGGTQRPDLTLGMHLWIVFLAWAIPLAPIWLILRLSLGGRGGTRNSHQEIMAPGAPIVIEPARPWSLAEVVEQNKARRRGETWRPQTPRPPRRAAG